MTDPAAPLRAFTAALGQAATSEAAYAALHELAQALVGARLFTIMALDNDAGLAWRAYTSDPASYPATGTKAIERNPWSETVLKRRETFVANTLEAIAQVFPDHALIESLGCGSVVNLPILQAGAVAATINLLDAPGHYTPERVARIEADLTLPAMAALHLAARLDGR